MNQMGRFHHIHDLDTEITEFAERIMDVTPWILIMELLLGCVVFFVFPDEIVGSIVFALLSCVLMVLVQLFYFSDIGCVSSTKIKFDLSTK